MLTHPFFCSDLEMHVRSHKLILAQHSYIHIFTNAHSHAHANTVTLTINA